MTRKPSNLISCSHSRPEGVGALLGRHGGTKPAGKVRECSDMTVNPIKYPASQHASLRAADALGVCATNRNQWLNGHGYVREELIHQIIKLCNQNHWNSVKLGVSRVVVIVQL
jgi:hypothetical protein